ncbi:MAG: TIGR03790 family protein [Thermoguttaceae bacterium]|jgi:uncharacterized protein (TIGR03790 family)
MRWANSILLVPWLLIIIGPAALGTISPDNVLVLYNPAWTDGTHGGDYIAKQYASTRGIPLSNVIGLQGLGTSEDISASDYLTIIRPQVETAISTLGTQNNINIDTIVTTKGLPLRITNYMANPADPNNPDGFQYTDASGIQRTIYYDYWQPYSSLESELTRINTIGVQNAPDWLNTALLQMGDQSYTPRSLLPYVAPHFVNNPYYQSTTTSSFSHTDPTLGGMYLTSRLDGFTVSDVTAAITKAKNVYLLPIANSSYVVMDNDPNADVTDQAMVTQLKNVLGSGNTYFSTTYNPTTAAVTTALGPVIGYDTQGVHGGMGPEYINTQLQFQKIANGAVFNSHESYNAFTFDQATAAKIDAGEKVGPPDLPPEQWRIIPNQGLVAQWLGKGGTVGVGNVDEPQNGPENEANEDQMITMLLDGKTWGEAAWSSLYQLSYVNTVVGDPLMTWKQVTPGDINIDGKVDLADLAIMGKYWGAAGQAGGYLWNEGDLNGDGAVNSADLAILGKNWGNLASWATEGGVGTSQPLDMEAFLRSVPEPSTLMLLVSGLLALLMKLNSSRHSKAYR